MEENKKRSNFENSYKKIKKMWIEKGWCSNCGRKKENKFKLCDECGKSEKIRKIEYNKKRKVLKNFQDNIKKTMDSYDFSNESKVKILCTFLGRSKEQLEKYKKQLEESLKNKNEI